MWKYVSRRIKDTLDKSSNLFGVRNAAGVANPSTNSNADEATQRSRVPCLWACQRKCWNGSWKDENTNRNHRYYGYLNHTWIGAITWSSALVLGWYATQLMHLKRKYRIKKSDKQSPLCTLIEKNLCTSFLFTVCQPSKDLGKKKYLDISEAVTYGNTSEVTPIHLISNDHSGGHYDASSSQNSSSSKKGKVEKNDANSSTDGSGSSSIELSDVLSSIENKLGLAAIENGQHQDGLNMLRSAASRKHPPALYNLGLCYELGLGIPVDEKMALEMYSMAAALEHPRALYNLAVYYGQGRAGLAKDKDTATRLLRLAALKGQEDAIKALQELQPAPDEEPPKSESWYPKYDLPGEKTESVAPTHSHLFVDHVNSIMNTNDGLRYRATVY